MIFRAEEEEVTAPSFPDLFLETNFFLPPLLLLSSLPPFP